MTSSSREHSIPTDILDDLCSRFIINIPEEERTQTNRLMFQVELAHWFYTDFYCEGETTPPLQSCGFRQFAVHVLNHLPSLRAHLTQFDVVLARWREYKQAVPTCGAALLTPDLTRVLLVQGYYSRSWGFPKGKCNESELAELHRCAVREVREEVGYDIEPLLNRDEFLEQVINDQRVRLYIIPDVAADTQFHTLTRNEIKQIEWFTVTDLPTSQKDLANKTKLGLNPNSMFMVIPFVRLLKRWIHLRTVAGGRRTAKRDKNKGDPTPAVAAAARQRRPSPPPATRPSDEKPVEGTTRSRRRGSKGLSSTTGAVPATAAKVAPAAARSKTHRPAGDEQPVRGAGGPHESVAGTDSNAIRAGRGSVVVDDKPRTTERRLSDHSAQPSAGQLTVPSCWANFKLDTAAILAAYDGK